MSKVSIPAKTVDQVPVPSWLREIMLKQSQGPLGCSRTVEGNRSSRRELQAIRDQMDKSLLQTVLQRLKYNIGKFEILVGLISLGLASIIFTLYSRKRRLASPNEAATLFGAGALTMLLSRKVSKTR